ncbi:MAG: 30S ribosomal protein S7 [Candidatus Thermoplasmatota archaeon]|nr:30S ribosomal protein S7 [Candidatus Thermoplasmatota archaeon]MBS3789568.1 30S ribosomal protein S7 [Candidatus Thermoplasmatota archaeon]
MTEEEIEEQETTGSDRERLYESLDMPLLFGKYDMKEVEVTDPGLEKYMDLLPILLPHSGGTHANKRFKKEEVSIIERLINHMMRTQDFTGKKLKSYNVVRDALDIIYERTEKNPVQVLVDAIENSAPREETTQITYGGISVPKAVDVSPCRRISLALSKISQGAVKASYKNKKDISTCLAEELIMASRKDRNSFGVSKKEETERMAASAR